MFTSGNPDRATRRPPTPMSLITPLLANMSAPPRTTVAIMNRVAPTGFLVFSLATFWPKAIELKGAPEWHRSVFESGLRRLPEVAAVEAEASRLPGFLIATTGRLDEPAVVVRDEALVIALLSRRVGRHFIKARTPDYRLSSLLAGDFCVQDWRPWGQRREALR